MEKDPSVYSFGSKEKYGELRMELSPCDLDIEDACMIESRYTCFRCGAQPVNQQGEHYIQTTKGWITPLCPFCAKAMGEDTDTEVMVNNRSHFTFFEGHTEKKGYWEWGKDGELTRHTED